MELGRGVEREHCSMQVAADTHNSQNASLLRLPRTNTRTDYRSHELCLSQKGSFHHGMDNVAVVTLINYPRRLFGFSNSDSAHTNYGDVGLSHFDRVHHGLNDDEC